MRTTWILMSLILILLLVGCGETGQNTPTPFSTAAPTIAGVSDRVVQARIADLVNNPAAYNGVTIQVEGDYRRLPRLICDTTPHLSPATWKLASGEIMIQANGYETLLRPASSGSLFLTVEGRWQQWRGVVGCGKNAAPQEIWYLEVSRILSPNPIVHVTPHPDASGGEIAEFNPTATPDELGIGDEGILPEPPPDEDTRPPDDDPSLSPTPSASPVTGPPPPGLPTPTIGAPTITPTRPDVGIISPTPLPTTAATATATATIPASNDGTPTPTPTATATPDPSNPPTATPAPANQGIIAPGKITKTNLAAGAAHLWQFQVSASQALTIRVQPDKALNIALTVRGPGGEVIVNNQNSAPAGESENADLNLTAVGTYEILISPVSGSPGAYAVALFNDLSDPTNFAGSLAYGDALTRIMPALTDDMWHFSGTAGDIITIIITPQDSSDPGFVVFGPDMTDASDFIDSGAAGEPEGLFNFPIPVTGFYSILIQDFDYGVSNYRIALTRN